MWIKTQWGQLVNLDTASAIWAGEKVDVSKFCGGSSDEYNVEARLNTGRCELIETLDTFYTIEAAQKAVDLISEAILENRTLFDMKEVPREGKSNVGDKSR